MRSCSWPSRIEINDSGSYAITVEASKFLSVEGSTFAKDMILEAAYGAHTGMGMLAFWLGCAAALLTAFYSWRLLILAFHGTPRASDEVMAHVHESPMVMLIPLGLLSIGSIFAGAIWYSSFFGKTNEIASFFGVPYAEASEHGEHKDDHSGAKDDHGEAKDDHAAPKDDKKKKTSYAFTGKPGEGAIYTGKVARIVDFGAFITILPGKDGLLHISQIANERVENVTDVVKEGDKVAPGDVMSCHIQDVGDMQVAVQAYG